MRRLARRGPAPTTHRHNPLTQDEKYQYYAECAKRVYVDFDGTLCRFAYPGMGAPTEGARAAMRRLQDMGLEVVVWSSRMSPEIYTLEERASAIDKIRAWLLRHDIPFDWIDTGNNGKALGLCHIDDRAVSYTGSWGYVIEEVLRVRDYVEREQKAVRGAQ